MGNFAQDLRHGLRVLRKSPGLTFLAILTLSLAVGLNTALASLLRPFFFSLPPIADAHRVAAVWSANPRLGMELSPASYPDYADWKSLNRSFLQLTAYSYIEFEMPGGAERVSLRGKSVDFNFFELLGVKPVLGRLIGQSDAAPGAPLAVVISEGLWKRRFAADPRVLSRIMLLDEASYTIVGVVPADFYYPVAGDDVWVLLRPEAAGDRARRRLSVIGLFRPGVDSAQAQPDFDRIATQLEQAYPATNSGWRVLVRSLRDESNKKTANATFLLYGPVFLILLIACGNVSNLLLAQATARRAEMAVRLTLGATRARLVRQLLSEALILSTAAGALGLLVAYWGIRLLRALFSQASPLLANQIRWDVNVLGFGILLAVLTPLFFALAPALSAARGDLSNALRDASPSATGGRLSARSRGATLSLQVALVLVLVHLTIMLTKATSALESVNVPCQPENLLVLSVQEKRSARGQASTALPVMQILDEISQVAGVEIAAATNLLPGPGRSRPTIESMLLEGESAPSAQAASRIAVTPGYFRAACLSLVAGRGFTADEVTHDAPEVIVSEAAAKRFWPGQNPLGRRFRFPGREKGIRWLTVVGVSTNLTRQPEIAAMLPALFVPFTGQETTTVFLARTRGIAEAILPATKAAVWRAKGNVAVEAASVRSLVDQQLEGSKLIKNFMAALGVIAGMLAMAGVYGVTSYSVAQRTREIGVRIALGASRRRILRLVLLGGLRVAAIGIVFGLPVAVAAMLALSKELGQTGATNPWFLPVSAAVMLATTLAACFFPARRATAIQPMAALRHE